MGEAFMILEFFHRKARPLVAFGVVAVCVSVAATVGWITAPV